MQAAVLLLLLILNIVCDRSYAETVRDFTSAYNL